MTTALFVVPAVALLFEAAGLLYCAIRNVPFGRPFGAAVLVQISTPATFIAIALVCEYFSPTTGGLEPFAGTSFARGFGLYLVFIAVGYVATLIAGSLGLYRIIRHAADQAHNA